MDSHETDTSQWERRWPEKTDSKCYVWMHANAGNYLNINDGHKAQCSPITAQKKVTMQALLQNIDWLTWCIVWTLSFEKCFIWLYLKTKSYVCAFAHHGIYKLCSFSNPLKIQYFPPLCYLQACFSITVSIHSFYPHGSSLEISFISPGIMCADHYLYKSHLV